MNLGLQLLAVSIANSLILQDAHKIYVNSELLTHDNFGAELIHSVENQLAFIPTKKDINIEILKKLLSRCQRSLRTSNTGIHCATFRL